MAKGSKPIDTEASLPATAQDEVKASSERGELPQTRDYHWKQTVLIPCHPRMYILNSNIPIALMSHSYN